MKRLFFLVFGAAMGCGLAAHAQMSICATPGENNAFLGIQTIRLWSGPAPQAKGDKCEDIPTITILEPHHGTENGSAVIIFPGGAYRNLAGNLEGRQYADWFTTRGFRAFIVQISADVERLWPADSAARCAARDSAGALASARLLHQSQSHRGDGFFGGRASCRARRNAVCARQSRGS